MADFKPVEPVDGELLRFRVRSDRDGRPYLVDLSAFNGNGNCQCQDFQIRKLPELLKGAHGFGHVAMCKHIIRARDFFVDEIIQKLLASGQAQDDAKQR